MVKVSRSSDTTIKVAMVANCDLANVKIALSIGSYTVECADVSNGEGYFVVSAAEIAKLGNVNYYADLKSFNKKTSKVIDAELVNVQIVETIAETKGYTTCRCTIPYELDDAERLLRGKRTTPRKRTLPNLKRRCLAKAATAAKA